MKTPFLFISSFLILGISLSRYADYQNIFLGIFIILSFIIIFLYNKNKNTTIYILIAFLFLGLFLGDISLHGNNYYTTLNGKFIEMKGTVYDVKTYENYSKYILEPEMSPKILVTQYGGEYPEDGNLILVRGIINIPESSRNPGAFNYRLFLKKNNIYATMNAKGIGIDILKKDNFNFFQRFIYNTKIKIEKIYITSMPERDAKFIISIFLGNNLLDEDTQSQFRDIGISHITSVAGMHVAIITGFILYLLGIFNIKRYSIFVVLPVLLFYGFITGGRPPVIRAIIMAAMFLAGPFFNKENNSINSISFAAFIILLFKPLMIYDVGFQLSFIATLSIIYFYKIFKNKLKFLNPKIKDIAALTLSAQLGTVPLTMYYFHYFSLIAVLSNIVIVPLVNIAVIFGFLSFLSGLIVPYVAYIINYANIPIIELILTLSEFFNSFSYASINTIIPPLLLILIYYFIIIVGISSINKNTKTIIYIASFSIVSAFILYNIVIPKNLEVIFIDVGQGDSTFIKTPNGKAFLIDGGGSLGFSNQKFDIGNDIVLPFLLYKGVIKLNAVFISHTDIDHVGGILSLIDQIKIDRIFIGEQKVKDENFKKLIELTDKKKIPVYFLRKGDKVKIDNLEFFILHPSSFIEENPINNNALVFKMVYKDVSFLFTGDIEKPAEKVLKDLDIEAQILKVPHHGSNTSSTKDFIQKVNPKICIIQVGKNSYGLPNKEVINFLEERSKVYRNDINGAIIIKSNGKKIFIDTTIKEEKCELQ